jgi:hypothetical protein
MFAFILYTSQSLRLLPLILPSFCKQRPVIIIPFFPSTGSGYVATVNMEADIQGVCLSSNLQIILKMGSNKSAGIVGMSSIDQFTLGDIMVWVLLCVFFI